MALVAVDDAKSAVLAVEESKEQEEVFKVDDKGNGTGRVESTNGDVYEGDFKHWKRHGRGVQVQKK